ncbi:MAG: hypothetical protein HKL80_05620 [Acidimicrobiales bacterium]|nr:hypothetical protein [Acidimicrobiales bacterium]
MPARESIRNAQKLIATLDGKHSRAKAGLELTQAKRAHAIENLDRLVAQAQSQVNKSIVDMADVVGVELTASLLDLESSYVQKLVKTIKPSGNGTKSI